MAGPRAFIESFGGQIPILSDRLLPPTHAVVARDVKLRSGEIRGLRGTKFLTSLPNAQRAYRIIDPGGVDGVTWLGVNSLDTTVLNGPLVNDSYDRFYMFGDGAPKYNTLARIRTSSPWFLLGIPVPVGNGTITPTGGSAPAVTRFYVYTLESAYGEEGPPSTPVEATGPSDATWTLAVTDTTVPDASQRNITSKNIYRTVPGFSTAEFFFVASIPLATASYADTISSAVVSRNRILESEQWFAPIATIEGAFTMPNGFFLAWSKRDIYFCETYRPHAWPPPYDLSIEHDVLGGGVFGQSAGLVTMGSPYVGSGASPESMTLTQTSTVEPGLSRHGIVTMPYGVLYPSQNGLILLNTNGPELATRQTMSRDKWLKMYSPSTLKAASFESAYIGFYDADHGLMIDPTDTNAAFVELTRFTGVDNIQTDPCTGEVFLLQGGSVLQWDSIDRERVAWQWRSKEFVLKQPGNFGAGHIKARPPGADEAEFATAATAWNEARLSAGGLDFLGGGPVGLPVRVALTVAEEEFKPQNQGPFGGSPLIDLDLVFAQQGVVTLRVFADGVLRYEDFWRGQKCIRLPSGFKADVYQFEITGKRDIYSLGFAGTCKGLADV